MDEDELNKRKTLLLPRGKINRLALKEGSVHADIRSDASSTVGIRRRRRPTSRSRLHIENFRHLTLPF
jgi:hypothetical protein